MLRPLFNSMVISLLLCGDVHPHPGPEVSSQISAQIPYSENGLSHCLNFSLLNTRSLRNKTMEVKDFVVDFNVDILALTGTWLRPHNMDDFEIGTLCPTGYRFLHVPRKQGRGGGVGILFKDVLNINTSLAVDYDTFEIMDVRLRSLYSVRILVIYRPPDNSSLNGFFEEFSHLLESATVESSDQVLITGDFNLHMDCQDHVNDTCQNKVSADQYHVTI